MADNARDFSGSNQYITKTDPTGITVNAAWTVGCWLAPDAFGGDGNVLVNVGGAGIRTRGVAFQVRSTGVMRVQTQASIADGATSVGSAGTWQRVGATRAGSGVAQLRTILNGADDGGANTDAPNEITTGDVFRASDAIGEIGAVHYNGKMAWLFWLQGVALSAANLDAALNNPQSLVTNYGPSGVVTANALKILWPMQCDNATEEDESGVGNDGTYTGPPTLSASGPSPSTPWDPCGGGPTSGAGVNAASDTAVNMAAVRAVTGAVDAVSATAATMYRVAAVDMGEVSAQSTVSAGIQVQKPMAASVSAVSDVTASFSASQVHEHAAAVGAVSSVSVSMGVVRAMAAATDAVSAASASVSTLAIRDAQADGVGTTTVAMSVVYALAASVAASGGTSLEPTVVLGTTRVTGKYAAEHRRAYALVRKAGQ